MGQLVFFAEFLEVSGLFSRWVADCPLTYTSPNAPAIVDILDTWLLSILDKQRRYVMLIYADYVEMRWRHKSLE